MRVCQELYLFFSICLAILLLSMRYIVFFYSSDTQDIKQTKAGGGKNDTFCVINNGAAGLPNFQKPLCGLITRIGVAPSPHIPLYGTRIQEVFVDAIPVYYSQDRWKQDFLANWPQGSPAYTSYFSRITKGTLFDIKKSLIL